MNIWADDLPKHYGDLTTIVRNVLGSKGDSLFDDDALEERKEQLEDQYGEPLPHEYIYHYQLNYGLNEARIRILEDKDEWENYLNQNLSSDKINKIIEDFEFLTDNSDVINFLKNLSENEENKITISEKLAESMTNFHQQLGRDILLVKNGRYDFDEYFNYLDSHISFFDEPFYTKEDFREMVMNVVLGVGELGERHSKFARDLFLPNLASELEIELANKVEVKPEVAPEEPTFRP